MTQLPMVIISLSDAHIAIARVSKILLAEEQPHGLLISKDAMYAVEAVGDFCYETAVPPDQLAKQSALMQRKADKEAKRAEKAALGSNISVSTIVVEKPLVEPTPFSLKDIDLKIPKGSFVVVFDRIGSGKSALLEGLLGEMRQTRGHVTFGGTISLVTQTPWIQSTSLRDNIVFGEEDDPIRLGNTITACALESDLEQLSDGINTEIGGECPHFLRCSWRVVATRNAAHVLTLLRYRARYQLIRWPEE
jgi:ATP-binding cassette subfamily C (CFTR/MRP) protein 1